MADYQLKYVDKKWKMENGRLGIKKCGKKKMCRENGRLGILKMWCKKMW